MAVRPCYFLDCFGARRVLDSFPTRRSSDLVRRRQEHPAAAAHLDAAARVRDDQLRRHRPRRDRPACLPSPRSEEHTSELQSHVNLVCRLLLEKKKVAVRTHFPFVDISYVMI